MPVRVRDRPSRGPRPRPALPDDRRRDHPGHPEGPVPRGVAAAGVAGARAGARGEPGDGPPGAPGPEARRVDRDEQGRRHARRAPLGRRARRRPAPAWDRISSSLLSRIMPSPSPQTAPPGPTTSPASPRTSGSFRRRPSRRYLAEVARDGALLAYGSPFGYRPLRETLAARLARRGVPADPDALLIVNGAQQGLDLITRALVDPGDAVAVESPSYAGALSLFRAHRARLLGVPLDAEGPEPGRSPGRSAERPKFLYTIPDFQNPTGLLARRPSRRARSRGARPRAGVLVVEDAFDADLFVEGELPPPLAALAPAHVVHLGTISQGALPGGARRLDLGAEGVRSPPRDAQAGRRADLAAGPAGGPEPLPRARRVRPPPPRGRRG